MPESFVTVHEGGPVPMLPLGVRVRSVALDCRSATVTFLRGSGWGKRELAGWLLGRYRPIAALVPGAERDCTGRSEDRKRSRARSPIPSDLPTLCPLSLLALIDGAKRGTVAAVRAALEANPTDFAVEAIQHGNVLRVEDFLGEEGWVPVDRPRMRLTERLISLVTAHRLTDPEDFEESWAGLQELQEELAVDEAWYATTAAANSAG